MNKIQPKIIGIIQQSVISGCATVLKNLLLKTRLLKAKAQHTSALINLIFSIALSGTNSGAIFRAKGISGTGLIPVV